MPIALWSPTGTQRYIFNATFFAAQVGNSFNLAPVQIPRAHRARILEPAYLNGKTISVSGVLGSTNVDPNEARGANPWGVTANTPETYFDELRRLTAFLHSNSKMLLDYRNGFLQYVTLQGVTSGQESGWPDLRGYQIALYAADPLGYSIEIRAVTLASNLARLDLSSDFAFGPRGNSPSQMWRMNMMSTTTRTVDVYFNAGTDVIDLFFSLAMEANVYYIVDGYNRTIKKQSTSELAWSAWQTGGKFPTLLPNSLNDFRFYSSGSAITIGSLTSGETLKIDVASHDADWLVDTFPVGANVPPGQYDIALYDFDFYA